MRVLENTLQHLSETLEAAEHATRTSARSTALQTIDPRVKVASALLLIVAVVASRNLLLIVCVFVSLTLVALCSNIPWKRVLATWISGFFFGALVAIPAAFAVGTGLATLLFLRSETCLTCWLLVIMTTPFNWVLRALRSLRVPLVFVAILAMTFRYIFLLIETAQDMLLSRRSRIVARISPHAKRKLLVSTAAILISKSLQMSDDVYHAMASRGFRGEVYVLDDFVMRRTDWFILVGTITFAAMIVWVGR